MKPLDFDVVLSNYATLAAEFSGNSVLHELTWYRIVLDEGVHEKQRSSLMTSLT
jgi:SNF2 family DNA or RNA helicase